MRAIFSLPLLAKELTEIAARRRTYVTRVVYALLLMTFFLAINYSTLRHMSLSPLYAMGMGRNMFAVLIALQIVGICLFLPAFAAGLITQEKERDSLAVLFLTELTPWQILLQKFASGLIAILPFMLIGMPLAALCYAYGGISPRDALSRYLCALAHLPSGGRILAPLLGVGTDDGERIRRNLCRRGIVRWRGRSLWGTAQ